MSGLFDSFVSSLNSTRSRSDSIEMAKCYNLFVHHNECIDIADDIAEPPAFQIPLHMKWRDIHGLVVGEIGCGDDTEFLYMDDENDEVRINSQEEYETALHICRKEHCDLHIYNVQSSLLSKGPQRKKTKHKKPRKTKVSDLLACYPVGLQRKHPPWPPQPDEDSSKTDLKENTDYQRTNLGLPKSPTSKSSPEGAVGGEVIQMDEVTSNSPAEDERETKPFPPSSSLISLIRKEADRVVFDEVNELWAFVNTLRKEIRAELDDIRDQLASQRPQAPGDEMLNKDHLRNAESQPTSISTASSQDVAEEVKEIEYAASFICENLPDDSIISCGQKFEKYWVFKNEGNVEWDKETRLHLLDESCNPSAATGSSLSEWGAVMKSVSVPLLKEGETGVVCASHLAPAHPCDYQSSWRLSNKNNPFGPRVWCNMKVDQGPGSPVDEASRSLESFVDLTAVEPEESKTAENLVDPEAAEDEKTEDAAQEEQSVIPPLKVQNDKVTKEVEEQEPHPNLNVMSFDMGDIGDGAKYIDSANEEEVPHFNPAVSTVKREDAEDESKPVREDGVGASVDSEASQSLSSASPVLVSPPSEAEADVNEEQQTLDAKNDEGETEEEVAQEVENFLERTVEPHSFSSDEESDAEDEETEPPQPQAVPRTDSEDLQSVDFALEEEPASLASFASGFVVVPLPDCFDVNKPLNGSQYLEDEDSTDSEPKDEESKSVDHDADPNFPPEESDSEPESQPPSVTLAADYRSEDSIATTSPKFVNPPQISLPPPSVDDAPPSGGVTLQPESVDNESLTERIHKEFDEFLANPEHPVDAPVNSKPKIPMNQMPTSTPKITLYAPDPKPVPTSVVNFDAPYEIPNSQSTPTFPPFEQGWRRNPIAVPPTVTNTDPWPETKPTPAPRSPLHLPTSQSTPDPIAVGISNGLPSVPFAVASPSESIQSDGAAFAEMRRPLSSQIAIADDFYPVALAMPGSNVDPDHEEYDLFRTPPVTPPAVNRSGIESGPLDQLYEMGFNDIDLNRNIFESCERDLSRTVQALVLRAEADQRYNETA